MAENRCWGCGASSQEGNECICHLLPFSEYKENLQKEVKIRNAKMTENQKHEHEWQEEDDNMVCSKCKAWTYTKWFFDIRNEGMKNGILAENKRVLDIATEDNTFLNVLAKVRKYRDYERNVNETVLFSVWREIVKELALLRLKEDEKK